MKKLIIGILSILFLVGIITPIKAGADHELHPMYYGPNGWAGWSCPAGERVVTGGYEPTEATVLFSGPAKPGKELYPIYPHYTYDVDGSIRGIVDETGWVVQAGGRNAPTAIWVECEPIPTPTPTPVPCQSNCGESPTFPHDQGAPQCSDGNTVNLPANIQVIRNGEEATVQFFMTEGDSANIYYKEEGVSDWTHSVLREQISPNADKFVSYTIHGLKPELGYTFGVQQVKGCSGGQTVTAVVVDGPLSQLFRLSYWEWSK